MSSSSLHVFCPFSTRHHSKASKQFNLCEEKIFFFHLRMSKKNNFCICTIVAFLKCLKSKIFESIKISIIFFFISEKEEISPEAKTDEIKGTAADFET